MRNILVVYYNAQYPARSTVLDHLYSFKKYAGARCYYLNAAVGGIPKYLKLVGFDLIVFHTIFLSIRWHRATFERAVERVRLLKELPGVKVALPQDEFINMDLVCDFINEFDVRHVFSVAAPSEWGKIYRTVNRSYVLFHEVLTGYLEESAVNQIAGLAQTNTPRTIDIGYRAWKAEPWLGHHGFLKTRIAEQFQKAASSKGLTTDISMSSENTLYGDDWYRFMLRCRYTIGVEGGASVLDWNGSVREKTTAYLKHHPTAQYSEVEAACFPGLDGQLNLHAISPRQFEACAAKTCQILIEGNYNGVLKPGVHYIELKRDFSNIEAVLDAVRDDTERNRIVENAYRDVVMSGQYGYDRFVQFILKASILEDKTLLSPTEQSQLLAWLLWRWMKIRDRCSWFVVRIFVCLEPLRQKLVNLLIKTPIGRNLREQRKRRAA